MPLTGYQLPSPRAIEPPSGEYALAAKSSNPDAFLYSYRNARELAQGDYDRELQAQHAFANRQQQAQIQNEQMHGGIELAKLPGGADFLANSPLGMALGGGPGALTNLAHASDQAQTAITLKNAMEAANAGNQAGINLPAETYTGITNLPNFQQGIPRAIQIANIDAAGRVAAAAAHGGGAGAISTTLTGTDPKYGTPVTGHASGKASDAAIDEWYRTHGGVPIDQPPPTQPLPNPASGSSLPPAQRDTDNSPLATVPQAAAAGNAASRAPNNAAAGTAALQQRVNANLGRMPAPVQADIRAAAAKNGNQPVVGVDEQGPYALGASGQKHR